MYSACSPRTGDGLLDTLAILSHLRELTLQADEGLRRSGICPEPGMTVTLPVELIDALILNLESARDLQPAVRPVVLAGVIGALAAAGVVGLGWALAGWF